MSKSKKMSNGKGKGGKTLLAPQLLTDLVLSLDGNVLTTTVSPNAVWSGIQKFVDPTTNDGAKSIGNWNYWSNPTDGDESVSADGPGHYRGWSSDANYDIHYSNWIEIV